MRTFATLRRLGARLPSARRRMVGVSLACVALAACAPGAPQTPADGYSTAQLRASQRQAVAAARSGGSAAIPASALAAAGIPVSEAGAPEPAGTPVATPAATPGGHVGLSDEQDFDAVSARESIESDKQRIEAQRAAYQQIAPEALPERPADAGIPVIDFALSTNNAPGQAIWPRPDRANQTRFARACAKYPSQDVAQAEFLKAGGPQVDKRGVDPDGDGFACFWDPTPFRLAREGAVAAPVAREVLPGEAPAGTVGSGGTMIRTSDFDETPLQ